MSEETDDTTQENPTPPDPAEWIQQDCLERLANAPTRGLAESILIASMKHRVPAEVGSINPTVVRRVLKDLEIEGKVEHSAGRWKASR